MITKRASEILSFIQNYVAQHDYSPTIAEIAKGIGIQSRGVVHRYLRSLEQAEVIKLIAGHKRNIQLIESAEAANGLPIVGKIAAGQPILAVEHVSQFDVKQLCQPQRFILQVMGNSMIGDNICDGDLIICEQRNTVQAHEIAVVLIENEEATLKRVRHNQNGTVTLLASNPNVAPMIYQAQQITIQGVYVGLLRMM